jgi:hypothetical protein
MPQNPPNITESPEFKEFCKKNNLEVFNQEAINVLLYQLEERLEFAHDRIDEVQEAQMKLEKLHNSLVDEVYNPKIETLKRCKELEERISKLEI